MSYKLGLAAIFDTVGLKPPVSLEKDLFDAISEDDAAKVSKIVALQPSLLTDIPARDSGLPQIPGAEFMRYALNNQKSKAAEALRDVDGRVLTAADENGMTFPMYYAKNFPSHEAYAKMFPLLNSKHVDAVDNDGNKLLHYAAMRTGDAGHGVSITVPFTSKDVNLPNKKGETPLMLTADFGSQTDLLFLQTSNADIHATDKAGLNATMHALIHSSLKNAGFLMQLGGKVDFANPQVEIQRTVATYDGEFEFLQILEIRRQSQQAEEKLLRQVDDIARHVQEGLERKKNSDQVVAVVKAGVASEVAAPERASFAKKTRSQTPV